MIGFAKKIGMTRLFIEGVATAVTAIEYVEPVVLQKKTEDKDGYTAIQAAAVKKKKTTKARVGHAKKHADIEQDFQYISEFKNLPEGKTEFKFEDFVENDLLDITGTTIGRGFTGAVKRWGFAGQPKTHGHDHERAVGSIGAMYPQRVLPGTKMAGRTGTAKRTIKKAKIVALDSEKKLIFVKGSLPGANSSYFKVVKVN